MIFVSFKFSWFSNINVKHFYGIVQIILSNLCSWEIPFCAYLFWAAEWPYNTMLQSCILATVIEGNLSLFPQGIYNNQFIMYYHSSHQHCHHQISIATPEIQCCNLDSLAFEGEFLFFTDCCCQPHPQAVSNSKHSFL